MMVVISIIMVLTGSGAVALNNFNNSQKLEGAKGELIADLRLARNMAITSQVPEGVSGTLNYVTVAIESGTLTSQGNWTNSVGGVSDTDYFSKSNESTINISSNFGFSIENGRLTDSSGILQGNLCLTLSLIEDGTEKYVEINSSGLIYEKESCI